MDRIEAFTPRLAFSGPIERQIMVHASFEYRFVRTPIENCQPTKRDTRLESFDPCPSSIGTSTQQPPHQHLCYSRKTGIVGLNISIPKVTPNTSSADSSGPSTSAHYDSKAVLESFFSVKKFDADVSRALGTSNEFHPPNVNTGNFFNRQERRSTGGYTRSLQLRATIRGTHFMKVGIGLTHTRLMT